MCHTTYDLPLMVAPCHGCQNPIAPYVLCSGVSLLSCIVVMIGCLTAPRGRTFGSAFSRLICLVVSLIRCFLSIFGIMMIPTDLLLWDGLKPPSKLYTSFHSQLAATFSGENGNMFHHVSSSNHVLEMTTYVCLIKYVHIYIYIYTYVHTYIYIYIIMYI